MKMFSKIVLWIYGFKWIKAKWTKIKLEYELCLCLSIKHLFCLTLNLKEVTVKTSISQEQVLLHTMSSSHDEIVKI